MRSAWILVGAVAGAFFGYATCYDGDPYWLTLTYIGIMAALGALAGLGWAWSRSEGER